MKKETKMNNKGFSLVELIIVIAIMAILVGVLAPQLLKYIEKTNVSADFQLADAVKTAVQTAIMDPAVLSDATAQTWLTTPANINADISISQFDEQGGALAAAIWETLGVSNSIDLKAKLKSYGSNTGDIVVKISSSNAVTVTITNTDATGKKTVKNTDISVR